MKKTLLSHLDDDVYILNSDIEHLYTVGELKSELENEIENTPLYNWFVATKEMWQPNAKHMVYDYIENVADDMYEDFESNAKYALSDVISTIQKILDDELKYDSICNVYRCDYDKPIEVDI